MYKLSKNLKNATEINKGDLIPCLVVEKILNEGPMSRVRFAKEFNFSKTLISKKVSELIAKGAVIEQGKGDNNLGKKEILIDINKDFKNIFVVDFSKNKLTIGIYNLKKEVVFEKSIDYPKAEEVLGILSKIVDEQCDKHLIDVAILSMPTVVKGLNIIDDDNRGFDEIFEETKKFCFDNYFKVKVVNDIDLETICIKSSEKYADTKNIITISGHYGIGGSIVINGEILKGQNNFAGEFGLLNPVFENDKVHNFEERHSLKSMYKRYVEKNEKDIDITEFKKIIQKNDESIKSYYKELIEELSSIIVNISYIVDINDFILTGDLFALYSNFKKELYKYMETFLNSKDIINIDVLEERNQNIIGAKILGIEYTFQGFFE